MKCCSLLIWSSPCYTSQRWHDRASQKLRQPKDAVTPQGVMFVLSCTAATNAAEIIGVVSRGWIYLFVYLFFGLNFKGDAAKNIWPVWKSREWERKVKRPQRWAEDWHTQLKNDWIIHRIQTDQWQCCSCPGELALMLNSAFVMRFGGISGSKNTLNRWFFFSFITILAYRY